MNEVKKPNKKPLIYYYGIAMLILILINSLLVPWVARQQIVEVEQGVAVCHYPLTEELENVEWVPGVITLEPDGQGRLCPVWMYPYDFTNQRTVAETQRRRLP